MRRGNEKLQETSRILKDSINPETRGIQFKADVYSLLAGYTPIIEQRVNDNYVVWLEKAQNEPEPTPEPTLRELQETNDMLTECILEMSEIIYGE